MKFIKQLEKYAKSVKNFPFTDLEVDYTYGDKPDTIKVSIYWIEDGELKNKEAACMTNKQFVKWVFTPQAERGIKNEVLFTFNDRVAYNSDLENTEIRIIDSQEGRVKRTPYKLVDPEGNVHEFFDVKQFCKDNKLSHACVTNVLNNTNWTHKGWHLIGVNPRKKELEENPQEPFYVENLEGETYLVEDIEEFCKEHGLKPFDLEKIRDKQQIYHRGWFLMGSADAVEAHSKAKELKKIVEKAANKVDPFTVVDLQGKEHYVTDIDAFCEEHDLQKGWLLRVVSKKLNNYKGFGLPDDVEFLKAMEKHKPFQAVMMKKDGKETLVTDPKSFCRAHDLSYSALMKVIAGKSVVHNGWHLASVDYEGIKAERAAKVKKKEAVRYKEKKKKVEKVVKVKPSFTLYFYHNDEPIEITNIQSFADEHGLTYMGIHGVKIGKNDYVQSKKTGEVFYRMGCKPKTFVISHKDTGKKIMFWNIKQACDEHGLSYNALSKLTGGHRNSAQGYILEAII